MAFELPDLPYAKDALEPHISAETLDVHHGKHHAAYVKKLNDAIEGTEHEKKSLEEIIKSTAPDDFVFKQAAQHWNHSFYWNCMSPDGGGAPKDKLGKAIEKTFGDYDKFRKEFTDTAEKVFGSGWAWLVMRQSGDLAVIQTSDAENPIPTDDVPLLTCDMWEHAYYIDYRNAKEKYLDAFWKVVNWSFVGSKL